MLLAGKMMGFVPEMLNYDVVIMGREGVNGIPGPERLPRHGRGGRFPAYSVVGGSRWS